MPKRAITHLFTGICLLTAGSVIGAEDVDFSTDIQPLFAQKCLECHGPDKQKGDLRLDDENSARPAIENEELIYRITTDNPDDKMPPKGDPLTADEIAVVKYWIEAGAPFEKHWAYTPLWNGDPPKVENDAWVRNPIDRFVLARLEAKGIEPSPEADRYTLIKRLYYDLIGLPPTPAQVDAFVNNESKDAYGQLVRRLLDSEHFGERWGRHWLDKARYADSDGYEKDRPRPNAWNYRDWVIKAVNADMPMDQFTIEQLAGDLLPNPTDDQKLATAFHRQTLTNTEGGTDKEEFRVEATFDRTETTGTIWLGLTMNCARCHNHKYDAISQTDYYQFYAFFNDGTESTFKLPNSKEAMAKYREEKAEHDAKLKALGQEIAKAKAGHEKAFEEWQKQLRDRLTKENPPKFHPLTDLAVKSDVDGVEFEVEKAGIVQVSGENPEGAVTYELTAKTGAVSEPVTGIRIDALTDNRLPNKGPGRVAHGNFVLNEVEVFAGDQKLEFSDATADFSQKGWDAKNLVDGDTGDQNGWAVSPQMGKPHHAILKLKKPLDAESATALNVKLAQNYGNQHTLGRFQIRLMTGEEVKDVAPKEIQPILAKSPEKRNDKEKQQLLAHFLKNEFEPTKPLFAEREKLEKNAPKEPVQQVRIITQGDRETKVLDRGNFLNPSEKVEAGGLTTLPPIDGRQKEGEMDRLDLAHWLMSEENPLPPRVLANHVWQNLFGEGLVRTMNDFGVRGEPPTHPELLDWLGAEYRRLGWSRKRFIETIVMSSTYRQSSAHREELRETDPNNHLLARQNRFRVEAEIVRDVCLSVAGLLSDKVGGPSVFPPLPPDVAALSYNNNFKWNTSKGADRYRRGMYTFFKRTAPHPNLVAFDCPDSNTTNVERRTSNTPIQALTTLNNETFVEAAQAFAKRALELDAANDRDRMTQALRFCIARPPSDYETDQFLDLLEKSRTYYRDHPENAEKLVGPYQPEGVEAPEAASWVAVARIALNLDELITRE